MKRFFIGTFVSFLLASCSSDTEKIIPEEPEVIDPSAMVTRCCEAAVTTGDSIGNAIGTMSRGWVPSAGDQYPFDYVYVLSDVEDEPGEYEPIESKDEVKMPITNNPGLSNVDMCFQVGPGAGPSDDPNDEDDDEVYITVDGKTIEVDDCIFSSVSGGEAVMDKSTTITTPGGNEVYEPYGDRLFFSDYFFEAEYEDGILTLERSYVDEKGEHDLSDLEIKAGDRIEIPLKRFTAVVNTKLVISHLKKGQTHVLTQEEFEHTFGNLSDWTVRVFLKNAPTKFNYSNMYSYEKGNDIIALSENALPFVSSMKHTDSHATPKECEGVGAQDDSEPFIFPMKTSPSQICYSFYYTGDKKINKKPILSHTTICIPVDRGLGSIKKFEANYQYYLTHLLDADDFIEGVTGVYDNSKSRSAVQADPVFGYVMDIPYQETVAVEKNK